MVFDGIIAGQAGAGAGARPPVRGRSGRGDSWVRGGGLEGRDAVAIKASTGGRMGQDRGGQSGRDETI